MDVKCHPPAELPERAARARDGILRAADVDAVARAAEVTRALPAALLDEGMAPAAVTAALSSLNDLIAQQLARLLGLDARLRSLGACWLALGSEGRMEQTLATDQDNAIVFADVPDPDRVRQELLEPALQMNQALDRCGFTLCRGNVMASNPELCLSLAEWTARFTSWIDRPEPQALLNATIFFDFRAIVGEPAPARTLRDWLTPYAQAGDRFLLLMVFNALRNTPPLGLLRDFALTRGGEHPHTLDLKSGGVQLFVEAGRILALSGGVADTSTPGRLAAGGAALRVPAAEIDAWRRSFDTIQALRLRLNISQLQSGVAPHNHLDPSTLDQTARVLLKGALRQARDLQNCLANRFSLSGTALRA